LLKDTEAKAALRITYVHDLCQTFGQFRGVTYDIEDCVLHMHPRYLLEHMSATESLAAAAIVGNMAVIQHSLNKGGEVLQRSNSYGFDNPIRCAAVNGRDEALLLLLLTQVEREMADSSSDVHRLL
jgi:hypothetical protein